MTWMQLVEGMQWLSPSKWGEEAARLDVSESAEGYIDYFARMSESVGGLFQDPETLEQCVAAIAAGGHCDITEMGDELAFEALKGLAARIGADAIGSFAGPLGPNPVTGLFNFGTGAGEFMETHQKMIEMLDGRDVEGFEHETVVIQGVEVDIWVDASAVAEGGSPTVYTDPDSFTHGDLRDEGINSIQFRQQLNAHKNKLESEAIDGAQQAVAAQGPDGYAETIREEIREGVIDGAAQELKENAAQANPDQTAEQGAPQARSDTPAQDAQGDGATGVQRGGGPDPLQPG